MKPTVWLVLRPSQGRVAPYLACTNPIEARCQLGAPRTVGGHEDENDRLVALFLANLDGFVRSQALAGRVY